MIFSKKSVELDNVRANLLRKVFLGSLKSRISMVSIAKTHKLDVSVFEDSPGSCQSHFLFHISSCQFRPIGLEANIN